MRRIRQLQRLRRLACSSSWLPLALATAPNMRRELLVDPATGAVFASVRLIGLLRPGPLGQGPRSPLLPVLVAGSVEPGAVVAIVADCRVAATVSRASAADIPPAIARPMPPPPPVP